MSNYRLRDVKKIQTILNQSSTTNISTEIEKPDCNKNLDEKEL